MSKPAEMRTGPVCIHCGGRKVKRCGTCKSMLCVRCCFYKRHGMTNVTKSDCISCYNRKRRKKYAFNIVVPTAMGDPTLDRLIDEGYIDDTPGDF